jgi:hypothetical protein
MLLADGCSRVTTHKQIASRWWIGSALVCVRSVALAWWGGVGYVICMMMEARKTKDGAGLDRC